jgi:hypothetical protein
MPKVKITKNPTGTVLGDLNNKLRVDLMKSIILYFDLTTVEGVSYPERLGGVLSALLTIVEMIEADGNLSKGVVEQYLSTYRSLRR